jgi:hypothetical protein
MSRGVPHTAIFAPRSADCVARVDEDLVNSDQFFFRSRCTLRQIDYTKCFDSMNNSDAFHSRDK